MYTEAFKKEIEEFNSERLKGKTLDEILTVIRGLKKKIGHLKNIVEHPEFEEPYHEFGPKGELFMLLLYLDETKRVFTELGGKYKLSAAEKKAETFDRNIPHIVRIEARNGNSKYGYKYYFFDLSDDTVTMEYSSDSGPRQPHRPWGPTNREEFLEDLRDIHMGTWRRSYTLERFNYTKYNEIAWYDEDEWWVTFYYDNQTKPVSFEGNRAYPHNYLLLSDLLNLLSIDVPEDVRLAQIEKDSEKENW